MSAMSNLDIEVNEALDKYIQFAEFDGDDYTDEKLRWEFIDAAVGILEKLTGRNVEDEIVY